LSERSEVYPFQRVKNEARRKQKKIRSAGTKRPEQTGKIFAGAERSLLPLTGSAKIRIKLDKSLPNFPLTIILKWLLLSGAGFLLGRAVLMGELLPFAPAYTAAAVWIYPASWLPIVAGVFAGVFNYGKNVFANIVTVLLTLGLLLSLPGENVKRPWLIVPGIVFALCVIVKTCFFAFSSSLPYDYIAVIFEAIFAAIVTLVFLYALPSLCKLDGVQYLSAEELLCVFIFFAAIVAGAGNLQIGQITFQGFLSRIFILTAAFIGGMGQGAAAGALMGIVPGLAYTEIPVFLGTYSFAGLLAGIGRALGKTGVAMGFLLGSIILAVYMQNFNQIMGLMAETGLSLLFFFLLPAGYVKKIGTSLPVFGATARDGGVKIQPVVTRCMNNWTHIFKELSHGYAHGCAASSSGQEEPVLKELFKEVENKVCSGCGLYRTCWEREFYRTYQSFLDIFTLVEIYSQITAEDLPENIKRRCNRAKELAITITCLYDIYKLNRYWMRRFRESKEIFSEQLKNVAEVIEELTQQLKLELETYTQKEIFLKEKLKQAGFPVVEVRIYVQENGKKEIFLKRQSCSGQQCCGRNMAVLLSQLMKEPLTPPCPDCTGIEEGLCALRFYPALKYQVKMGVAKIGKSMDVVSGDSYIFVPQKGGKFTFILSDGMGTGPQAALQSSTAVALLQNLLESGLNQDTAIKAVNSLLMLRSTDDNFATIDMVSLDLYTGQVQFFKVGAPPSLIAHGRRVSLVRASSLPAGIIKDIEITGVTKNLSSGDLLVVFSDGLLDAYKGKGDKEEWVKEILKTSVELDPQEISDLFLKIAQSNAEKDTTLADDVTVIVARLRDKKSFS